MITRQSQLESSKRGTEDVTGDCHVPAVPSASSSDASKVPNHVPDTEKLLINYCVIHSAYKKTKGSNMEQKWTLVKAELLTERRVQNWPEMTWTNLSAKFNRLLKDVQSKYALSREGVNLSGLPEYASDVDHMIMGILQELEYEQIERDDSKAKHQERQVIVILFVCRS